MGAAERDTAVVLHGIPFLSDWAKRASPRSSRPTSRRTGAVLIERSVDTIAGLIPNGHKQDRPEEGIPKRNRIAARRSRRTERFSLRPPAPPYARRGSFPRRSL